MSATTRRHWPDIAGQWARVGPPLRPVAGDIAFFAEAVALAPLPGKGALRTLILGVTPEIFVLAGSLGTDVVAVDHTQAMIDAVWPGPPGTAQLGEWTDLPLDAGSREVVFCDGGLHLLDHPAGQRALVENLARVLAPGGLAVLRLFVPPPEPEPVATVIDDLQAGRVADLNLLKLRLGMALQADPATGVELGRVWSEMATALPDPGRIGWDPDDLRGIDSYQDSPVRYHFVTVAEADRLFTVEPGGFERVSIRVPDYELGERCPTVCFRRSPR